MSRKKPKPELWQVWVMGSDTAQTYWLAKASRSIYDAIKYYRFCRADYLKVELKTPLGVIIESHDPNKEPKAPDKAEILERYGVSWLDYLETGILHLN